MMFSQDPVGIEGLRRSLEEIKSSLSKTKAKQVSAKSVIEGSKGFVRKYFDEIRPSLSSSGLDDESLGGLDAFVQDILVLTQKRSTKKNYEQNLRSIGKELNGVEIALVTTSSSSSQQKYMLDGKEVRVKTTLHSLVPSAALSYEQACRDLRDKDRVSFRGAAAELREALRELLDHLAPDNEVMAQDGFKLERNQKRPTMKQKVRFVLKSRGKAKSLTETPENAVEVIEERVGALARSVYTRSSISTHVGTSKQEVMNIKAYVDVVLSELLEIG